MRCSRNKNFESLSEKEQIWPSQQKEAVPIRSIKNLKLILKWFIDSTLSLESSQTLTQNTSWNKLVLLEGNRLNLGWFACSLAASGARKKEEEEEWAGQEWNYWVIVFLLLSDKPLFQAAAATTTAAAAFKGNERTAEAYYF